jgi:RNA polymerase primary sigma factor
VEFGGFADATPGGAWELDGMPATEPADDTLAHYLDDVRRHPLLSRGEELRLARLSATGDPAAKRRLVESNLRLVVAIARRYRGRGLDLLDLIQEGNVGLIAAVGRYDWRRGVRLATYASWWIRQRICRALSTASRLIRLPLRMAESAARVKRAELELARRLGRPATCAEVALAAGVDEQVVGQLRTATPAPVCLTESLAEVVGDDGAADPALHCAGAGEATSALSSLDLRRRRILELRYGLDGEPPRTLSDVAAELGVSRERVRRLETRALLELAARPELRSLRPAAMSGAA